MSKAIETKKVEVAEIRKLIENSTSMFIVDYRGLTVLEDTAFRGEMRKNGVTYRVLKNRLVKIALNDLGFTEFDAMLEGTNAFAFGSTDSVAPARIIIDGQTKYKKLTPKGGKIENLILTDLAGVEKISKLPAKEILIAQLLGLMQAPISGLARTLAAVAEKQAQA